MRRDVPLQNSVIRLWEIVAVKQSFLQTAPGDEKAVTPERQALCLVNPRLSIKDKHPIWALPVLF